MRPPILPPVDRVEHFPNPPGSGYLYGDRGTCRSCGCNLRRGESLFRECQRCEESPAPLTPEPAPPRPTYGCCTGHGYGK